MKEANIKENIENRIIDLITEGSKDKLVVFKPDDPEEKSDLVVIERGSYKAKKGFFVPRIAGVSKSSLSITPKIKSRELCFKIYVFLGPSEEDSLIKEISKEDFIEREDFYLMFVYFDKVRQDINNIWFMPSSIFMRRADLLKISEGKEILRFETALKPSKEDKYARFLISKEGLGELLLKAIRSRGDFDFLKISLSKEKEVNLVELKRFVAEARGNVYSGESRLAENPRLPGSLQLEYQRIDYSYYNICFSGSKFSAGQEIVYLNNKALWTANYFGNTANREVDKFLKESLVKMSGKCRFGGHCSFKKRELEYKDEGRGGFEYFSGEEQIYKKDQKIYELVYRGGLI